MIKIRITVLLAYIGKQNSSNLRKDNEVLLWKDGARKKRGNGIIAVHG